MVFQCSSSAKKVSAHLCCKLRINRREISNKDSCKLQTGVQWVALKVYNIHDMWFIKAPLLKIRSQNLTVPCRPFRVYNPSSQPSMLEVAFLNQLVLVIMCGVVQNLVLSSSHFSALTDMVAACLVCLFPQVCCQNVNIHSCEGHS